MVMKPEEFEEAEELLNKKKKLENFITFLDKYRWIFALIIAGIVNIHTQNKASNETKEAQYYLKLENQKLVEQSKKIDKITFSEVNARLTFWNKAVKNNQSLYEYDCNLADRYDTIEKGVFTEFQEKIIDRTVIHCDKQNKLN